MGTEHPQYEERFNAVAKPIQFSVSAKRHIKYMHSGIFGSCGFHNHQFKLTSLETKESVRCR